jgi:hypothetical protein
MLMWARAFCSEKRTGARLQPTATVSRVEIDRMSPRRIGSA